MQRKKREQENPFQNAHTCLLWKNANHIVEPVS